METYENQMDWKGLPIREYIDTEDSDLQEILMRCWFSTQFFMKTFQPDIVDGPWTWQRRKNLVDLDDDTLPFGGTCGYRALGKTTLGNCFAVRNFAMRRVKFMVWLSKTEEAAIEQTEAVKQELIGNPLITEVFGVMRPQNMSGMQMQFSRKAFFVADPKTGVPFAFCNPRGIGQPIRGKRITLMGRSQRPDFLFADDTEDDAEVLNPDYRANYRRYFYGSFLKCVDMNKLPDPRTGRWPKPPFWQDPDWLPPWRVWINDTIKHEDGNMNRLLQNGTWNINLFPQAEKREDGKYYSLVPEIVTDEQVRAEARYHAENGLEDQYAMEILCMPMAPDGSGWTRGLYQYYGEDEVPLNDLPREHKFIVVDPAKTSKATSANSAALVVAVDVARRRIHFRSLYAKRVQLDELPHVVFDMAMAFNTPTIYLEITGQEEVVELLWENARAERGLNRWIEFCWLDRRGATPKGDFGKGREAVKRAHSSLILPFYRRGEVLHERSFEGGLLERQQLSYPKCSEWDAMDCASYVPHIMQRTGIVWAPKIMDSEYREVLEQAKDYRPDGALARRIRSREWALQ